jgi:hypothetical protein
MFRPFSEHYCFCNHFGKPSRRLRVIQVNKHSSLKLGSQSSHYFTFSYALYEVRSSEARSLGQEQVPQRVRQEGQVREGRRDDAER